MGGSHRVKYSSGQIFTSEILNILAAREHCGSTIVTSQFAPEDWYKSLRDEVIAGSILNRLVSTSELIQLRGPNMRQHEHAAAQLTAKAK